MSSSRPSRVIRTTTLLPTRYDRAASLLISTLILASVSVGLLVVLWLGTSQEPPILARPVHYGKAQGVVTSEFTELDVPELAELPQMALAQPVAELSTLLSSEAIAAADAVEIEGAPTGGRPIGGPLPPEKVPRWERWEIRYEAASVQAYARQLDFFGIELGAVGRKPLVDYASHLTREPPVIRSGSGSDEKRLYLTWRGGPLQAMDRTLLERAGIDVAGRQLLQFYPQQIEEQLAAIEQAHTKDGRVDQLRKTVFGVRRTDNGYEFFVIEQR